MNSNTISVTSIHEIDCAERAEEKTNQRNWKYFVRSPGFLIFGIIGLCVLFAIPWTTIPRTNSIIYQSYWMEALLPTASIQVLFALTVCLDLATWTKENDLMSFANLLKLFFMGLTTYTFLYIFCYAIWSAYFQLNHPMPLLGAIAMPMLIISSVGLRFILPSHLLAKEYFRQSLQVYMFYQVWVQALSIQKEILSYLFANAPAKFQFLVPFMVAGCRELNTRVTSKLVTKMSESQDEAAKILVAVHVSCDFCFFIAIRLVGAALPTVCTSVAIDFVLHSKMTYEIIKELKKVSVAVHERENTGNRTKLTKLIIAELIEGLTPIIYGICIAMAYYGPNANIFSNIGNNYWSETIKSLTPLYVTMFILFAVDAISVAINSFCLWKMVKINIIQEYWQTICNYWFFMAIFLAADLAVYFGSTDINFGMDETQSFHWVSNDGWIKLINDSYDIAVEEKIQLLSKINLQ